MRYCANQKIKLVCKFKCSSVVFFFLFLFCIRRIEQKGKIKFSVMLQTRKTRFRIKFNSSGESIFKHFFKEYKFCFFKRKRCRWKSLGELQPWIQTLESKSLDVFFCALTQKFENKGWLLGGLISFPHYRFREFIAGTR